MCSARFAFLNTTGMPGLPPSKAKRIRAHVTRTNFAKRRQQIAEAEARNAQRILLVLAAGGAIDSLLARSLATSSPQQQTRLLTSLWSQIFLDSSEYPNSPAESEWLNMLISEPALLESSLAVTTQHWTADVSRQQNAHIHSIRAVNILIQRLNSRQAHTDAVLAVVCTMAIGGRLANDDIVWSIHMKGLTHLIRERYARGIFHFPSWFTDLLLSDSINNLFNFPRVYHSEVINSLNLHDNHPILCVATVYHGIAQLWESIASFQNCTQGLSLTIRRIEDLLAKLHHETQSLCLHDSPAVRGTALALQIILYMSWPTPAEPKIAVLAGKLKEALGLAESNTCCYLDFSSFQLMVGAISAEIGSSTRIWFLTKLKAAVSVLQSRGWDTLLNLFHRVMVPNERIMLHLKILWAELYT